MAYVIAQLMRYGIEPREFWGYEHMTPDGHVPPPVNPNKYRSFLIAAATHLMTEDSRSHPQVPGS